MSVGLIVDPLLLSVLGLNTFQRLVPRLEVLAEDLCDRFLSQILGLEET